MPIVFYQVLVDGLPGLVVDRYGPVAVLRIYSSAWVPSLELVVNAISRLPWVKSVYRRLGVKIVDGSTGGDLLFGPEPSEVVCRFGGWS